MTTFVLLMILAIAGQPGEAWILDYGMTQEDCVAALDHLPSEARPLPLATGPDDVAPSVSFACDPE